MNASAFPWIIHSIRISLDLRIVMNVYEGRRLAIKIASPNTIIQDIIVESATNFNLDPSKCVLKHKRNIVSSSQLFRFSNISNNAEVELIFEKSKSVMSPCKIAVTLPSGQSVTKIIPCESTLFELIQLLINDGNISSDTVSLDPELIYLRNSYSGDILKTLTLQSLGLAGQAIRFTLKVSIQNAALNTMEIVTNEIDNKMEVEKHSTIQNTEANVTKTNPQILVSVADHKCLESNLEVNTDNGDKYRNTEVTDSTNDIPVLANAFDCLEKIITDNFDRVTIPAVITLAKYFNNIIENPYNNKFRTINMNNKVFQSTVANTRGTLEYLLSVGFIINESKSSLQYPEHADTTECSNLRIRCKELYAAMDRLNIPTENRPVQLSEYSSSAGSSSSATQSQTPLPFDPFKASVVRQAPQPIRNEVSSIDSKIELLQKKRAEMEGRIDDVERKTEVFYPDQKEGVVKLLQHEVEINVNEDYDNEVEDPSVVKMVNRSIAKVLKNSLSHEDAPLTTSSFKALRQLEKEKVYKQLLIRIRFPDKKIIQGYFHPRHKMSDIYSWLDGECISNEFKSLLYVSAERSNNNSTTHNSLNNDLLINKKRQQNGQSNYCFELYQSPPYRALLSREESDLLTLRLAPAAVINLKWNYDLSAPSFAINIDFLSEKLSSKSADKYEHNSTNSMCNSTTPTTIPVGVPLVQSTSFSTNLTETKSNNLISISSSSDTAADSKVNSKETWKPKWFKT